LSLAASEPERFVIVDATADIEAVRGDIDAIVAAIDGNKID
jgi:thymidylate kinase